MRPIVKFVTAAIAVAAIAGSALAVSGEPSRAQNAPAAPQAASDQVKQMPLTEPQIQHFLAARKDIDGVLDALPDSASGQPDAATQAKLDAIAKKNGFANSAEYEQVSGNIELVMAGIDPKTKKYLGADGMLKQQIAAVEADKTMNPKDKADTLGQLKEDLKEVAPVQNPGNIELVTKYFDRLNALMSQD